MSSRPSTTPTLPWQWLGRVEYQDGLTRQRQLRDRLLAGDESAACVLLLEHAPVITLGKSADERHLLTSRSHLATRGIALHRTDRGGDITYHGPGQLMVYPVLRLGNGLVPFLSTIAVALAEVAEELGVVGATWRCDPAGLWLGQRKLAACGVHLRRSVCTHGFAFNVATPEEPWQLIQACGLPGNPVTSLARECRLLELPAPPPVARVAELTGPRLARALADHHRSAPA